MKLSTVLVLAIVWCVLGGAAASHPPVPSSAGPHKRALLIGVSKYARGGNPPELIKAFHWHKKQWDYWDVVQGNARVVLVDLRSESATCGRIQTLILGENSPAMVAIPPYVAHGYQVLDLRDVVLNYYVTEPYDPTAPDEGRIAWNDPRIGFDWTIQNI